MKKGKIELYRKEIKMSYKEIYKKAKNFKEIKEMFFNKIKKKYSRMDICDIDFFENFIVVYYFYWEKSFSYYKPGEKVQENKTKSKSYFYIYPTSLNIKKKFNKNERNNV